MGGAKIAGFDFMSVCPEWDFICGRDNVLAVTLLLTEHASSSLRQIASCPFKEWALRRHLYLGNLAPHLCPLDLPGGFVIGVGLLQLPPSRLLLPQLLPKLLQQRPQGLQHPAVLPELHGERIQAERSRFSRHT